jgi:hypothetical protein
MKFLGEKRGQNSTTVAVKKQNIVTVAATIINKRLNSHSAALKNRQENHTEKTLCTGKKTHHSEVWRKQRQRNRRVREMQRWRGKKPWAEIHT